LEKMSEILYSTSENTKAARATAQTNLNNVQNVLEDQEAVYIPLANAGAFDLESLIVALQSYMPTRATVFPSKDGVNWKTEIERLLSYLKGIHYGFIVPLLDELVLDDAPTCDLSAVGLDLAFPDLSSLLSSLTNAAGSLPNGDDKNKISAAITALTTYNGSNHTTNLTAVASALDAVLTLVMP
jgi:hypothetical protein